MNFDGMTLIVEGVEIQNATKEQLERLHWKCFGIWMKMRSKAKKSKKWGPVHAYAREVLDPVMFQIEQMGGEEE